MAKQNLVSLVKQLRPKLPGKVKKVDQFEYTVDDKVRIEFNYYCSWLADGKSKEDQAKECIPISVKISFDGTYLRSLGIYPSRVSDVFRSQVVNKKKTDGTINIEAVLARVTECIVKTVRYEERMKIINAEEAAREKQQEKLSKELSKEFEQLGLTPRGWRQLSWDSANDIVTIHMFGPAEKDKAATFELTLGGLTKAELESFYPTIMAASAFAKPESE